MALENLAMAAKADWYIVMKLTTANSYLTKEVKDLTYQLGVEMSTMQQLVKVTE